MGHMQDAQFDLPVTLQVERVQDHATARRQAMSSPPTPGSKPMEAVLNVAHDIAEEVRTAGRPRTWRKVTTILSAYGAYRLTIGLRKHIDDDFAAAGLVCEPSILDVDRSASVRLSLAPDPNTIPTQPRTASPEGTLPSGVTMWQRDGSGWIAALPSRPQVGIMLVDVELSAASTPELTEALPRLLEGLDSEALMDLITRDAQAAFKRPTGNSVRRASVFVVTPDQGSDGSETDKSVGLGKGLIEFVVGERWIVVARSSAERYINGEPQDGVQELQTGSDYATTLFDYGLAEATTAEAVALVIINHAVASFGRVQAYLTSWVETWRIENARDATSDKSLLINVQGMLPTVIDALEPLRHPNVVQWIGPSLQDQAKVALDQVERDLEALRGLRHTTAIEIHNVDQSKNEQYQRGLATLAAVLLAPGLVASVFGANRVLTDSPLNLIWLFLAMVIAGVVTHVAIARRLPRRSNAS
jgi:hypothetical protein